MKPRLLINLAIIVMPTLFLTWVVSAHDYTPPRTALPSTTPGPVDVVLVLDASESQAYDAPSGETYCATHTCAFSNPADNGCRTDSLGGPQYVNACIHACNVANDCHPFMETKNAAKAFIDQMRSNYDRVGVVSYNRSAQVVYSLNVDQAAAKTAIDVMTISDNDGVVCPFLLDALGQPSDDLWKCTSSNIGGGLRLATSLLSSSAPISQPAIVLLSTTSANATDPTPSSDPDTADWGFCPPRYDSTYLPPILPSGLPSKSDPSPLCRSRQFSTAFWPSHTPITPTGMVTVTYPADFDAKDYAVMWGKYAGMAVQPDGSGGMGARIFTIGLGKMVVCTTGYYNSITGVCTQPWDDNFVDPDTNLPNGAESLLRYISAVGDDGDPATNPCSGVASGQNCGNYYFASNSPILQGDLLTVANRLFTPTLPTANFSANPLTGVLPLTVTFTNQSAGDYTESLWRFGDGYTSTEISPTHTYNSPGSYTVTLQISMALETSVLTRTNYITVYTPVSADFSATPITGIHPLTVTFTNQSVGDYTTSLWNFGDSLTATTSNPTHTYTTAGSYTVTLTANGPGGSSTLSRTNYITVYTPVSADFSAVPITGVHPLTVTFTNHSIGDYDTSLWNFGDGLTATVTNPHHTYTTRGSFTVTLAASGPGGTSSVVYTNYITTYAPVNATFTAQPLSGTFPLTVTFTNESTGDYADVLWDFGDRLTSTLSSRAHVYSSNGTYTVTLQVSGPGGTDADVRPALIQVVKPEWKFYLPLLLR